MSGVPGDTLVVRVTSTAENVVDGRLDQRILGVVSLAVKSPHSERLPLCHAARPVADLQVSEALLLCRATSAVIDYANNSAGEPAAHGDMAPDRVLRTRFRIAAVQAGTTGTARRGDPPGTARRSAPCTSARRTPAGCDRPGASLSAHDQGRRDRRTVPTPAEWAPRRTVHRPQPAHRSETPPARSRPQPLTTTTAGEPQNPDINQRNACSAAWSIA